LAAQKAQKIIAEQPTNTIRKTYQLNDVNQAIEAYREKMSGGKILLTI